MNNDVSDTLQDQRLPSHLHCPLLLSATDWDLVLMQHITWDEQQLLLWQLQVLKCLIVYNRKGTDAEGWDKQHTKYPLIQALTRQKARTVSWKSSVLLCMAKKRRPFGRTLLVNAMATVKHPPNVTVTLQTPHRHSSLVLCDGPAMSWLACFIHHATEALA